MAQLGAARSTDPVDVTDVRAVIDNLDDQIINLLLQRAATSQQAQQRRLAAGGTRRDLNRERVLFARYQTSLGATGLEVAAAVLRLCRGNPVQSP